MSKIVIPKNAVYDGVNASGEIVYSFEHRPNMEQIFKEAERRYEPKTTICGVDGDIRVVEGNPFWVDDEVWVLVGSGKHQRVYRNGVWAEILGYAPIVMKAEPKPEEKLIMATSKYNGDQYIFLNHKTMGLWYQSDYYIVMASLCVLRQNSFAPFGGDSYNFSEITLDKLNIMLHPKGKYFDNNDETIKDLKVEKVERQDNESDSHFAANDWVVWIPTGQVGQIRDQNRHDGRENYRLKSTFVDDNYDSCYYSNLRMATIGEIKKHLKKAIPDEKPKFKIGDFVVADSGNEYLITKCGSSMYFITEDMANSSSCINPSTKENFESALAKVGLKFDYEKLTTEPIDEFAHLPQTPMAVDEMDGIVTIEHGITIPVNFIPDKYRQAFICTPRLLKLYEAWKDELDWTNNQEPKYVIDLSANNLSIDRLNTSNCLFSFATRKKAERFLELFRPLLEEYKPLMGGN